MNRRTILVIFVAMMGTGFALATSLQLKLYPAAIVNGSFISSREVESRTQAAARYYEKAAETYKAEMPFSGDALLRELRRGVLDKLIEDKLISREVGELLGKRHEELVLAKVSGTGFRTNEVEGAVRELYGFSLDEFERAVLVPQAERELLDDALKKDGKGEGVADWLKRSRENASVIMVAHLFRWAEGAVQFKEKNL